MKASCRSSKLKFLSSCFIADDSHVKVPWLYVVVFSEHDVLYFWDMSICLNIIQRKYLKIALSFQLIKSNLHTSLKIFLCTRQVNKLISSSRKLSEWNCDVTFWHQLQLIWFFKRIPLSISIIKLKTESLITQNRYNMNRDDVVLKIYLDRKFQWPIEGLNCNSLTCKVT